MLADLLEVGRALLFWTVADLVVALAGGNLLAFVLGTRDALGCILRAALGLQHRIVLGLALVLCDRYAFLI